MPRNLSEPVIDQSREREFKKVYDEAAVLRIFQKLAFISLLKDFNNFVRVFKPKG